MAPDSDASTASGPIEVLAFSGANSVAYLSAVFAAYREGRVVLALPKTPAIKNLPGTVIADRKAFDDSPGWFDERFDPIRSDSPAQISFSSGTTGRPKALLLSHRALADVVDRINAAMHVDGSIREYVGVPVTFSFGFGRCRAVAAAGGRAYLPPRGFDPTEIAQMLREGQINAISAVPTLWRILLTNPQQIGDAGAKVRWIEIGSQYMAAAEKLALRRLFPNAKIVQHYGLTEASRSTLLDISDADESRLESVGRATGDVRIAIGDDGRIRIRGPHLADGIVTGAGVKPITDADGWLTTSDLGRIDDGWLYYGGRADDLINCGGVKIDPVQFEQQLTQQLGCTGEVAVARAADPLRGEQVLIAARRESSIDRAALEQAALRIAEGYGLTGRGSLAFRTVESFPTTATGKVQRAKLSEMPDVGAKPIVQAALPASPAAPAAPVESEAQRLQKLWAEILGVPSVSLHESFYDMGGDSLSALAAIMRMETHGIDRSIARGILEGKSIAQMVGSNSAGAAPAAASPPASAAAAAVGAPSTAPASSGRAAELQKLWAEILGVEHVSLHESFYDLGGDSLSALAAIMRMETHGIDRDIARGILEGKSIAQMVGLDAATAAAPASGIAGSAPAAASAASPVAASGRAADLQKLWAEILGVPSVSLHESFYDLGGDSLSALAAIMRMETHGIDPAIARGILEGKSIAQIVGEPPEAVSPSAVAVAAPPPPLRPAIIPAAANEPPPLTLANSVNAVHAIRGLLILWVVVVHWLHGLLLRINESLSWIMDALAPAFRYGTPGFAMVFGVGVGALGIPHYRRNRDLFKRNARFNTKLIVGGVLFYALFDFLVIWGDGKLGDPNLPSHLFYSAISYYALAMLTLPLLVRILTIGSNTLLTILITGLACMLIHELLHAAIAAKQPHGWLELGKILLTAKYGYFRMTGFVMVGAAIGYLVRERYAWPGMPKALILGGLTLAGFGALTLYEVRPDNVWHTFGEGQPWHVMIFAGVTLVLMGVFCIINRAGSDPMPKPVRWVNAFLIASGILALPIFVGHEIVRPAKDILVNLGMRENPALLITVGLFLAAMSVVYARLMRFLVR